jgi:membrane associated rhomboid family serine protease
MVTVALILANLLAFAWELSQGGLEACYAHGLVPAKFLATGEVAPLVTSVFLHDPGTLFHLGCNMAFLAVFGPVVEREIGSLRLLALFLAAGVAGALMHVAVAPEATEPLVGASGAVFGVLTVAGVVRPRLLGFALAFGAVEVWHAFAGGAEGVSFGCHLGGLVAGALFAALWRDDALEAA